MKKIGVGIVSTAALLALTMAACDSNDTDELEPQPTGAEVWDMLQEADYSENWQRWPGTGELYEGSDPHGMLLNTYVNDAALNAIQNLAGEMPDGAVIVKENYMPDSTFDAITTMVKVEGYNPEHNDWFWVKQDPNGVVEVEGRVEGCQNCHGAVADNDYLYTGSLN